MNDTTPFQMATPKSPGDWSTWSINMTVPDVPGGKTFAFFRAKVTDSLGNVALSNTTRVFAYSPPSVAITSPPNNSHVTAGIVKISGTAYSPKPIQFVDLAIDGNASSYQRVNNTSGTWSTWSISYVIPVGSHYLTARVDDEMGRVAWNSVTIIGDGNIAPPTVAFSSPANNAHLPSGTVAFAGTTTGGSPISKVELSIDGNASSYQLATPKAPGDWSTWSINYNLPTGSHWFTARVTDSLNRQAWNSITLVGT